MIELFTHKQVHCEHCGFEFSFTGFGSAAKIVCPACGEENSVSPPPPPPPAVPEPEPLPELSEDMSQVSPEQPEEKSALCSVEHCPLLTGGESGNAIAEQLELRFRQKKSRRQTILAWTVTFQICVLIGTVLFIAQTRMLHQREMVISSVAEHTEAIPEKTPIELLQPFVVPSLAEMESQTAWNATAESEMPVANTEYPLSPYEIAQDTPNHLQPSLVEPPPAVFEPAETPPPAPPAKLVTLEMADDLLESAKSTLATDPESSVEQAVQAAKMYEQLGNPYPNSMYWVLSNAFASLSWGEPLLETSPAIETMTLSPDSRYLLAQLRDHTVWLWDLQELSSERRGFCLDSGAAEYVKFVFTPDLCWIIGGQRNGTIRIWDMSLENPAHAVITFTERILDLQDLQISPDGQWLAAYGNAVKGVTLVKNQRPHQSIQQVGYQQERYREYGTVTYPVLLWNLRQMKSGVVPLAMLVPSTSQLPCPVQAIRFSPHSNRLAVGRKDAVVSVYDVTEKGISHVPFILRGHQLGITQIAFAPNGQWLAAYGNAVKGVTLVKNQQPHQSIQQVGYQQERYREYGTVTYPVLLWNLRQMKSGVVPLAMLVPSTSQLPCPVQAVRFSPNSNRLAVGRKDAVVSVYDVTEKGVSHDPFVLRGHQLSITQIAFAPTGQWIATGSQDNTVRLWNLATSKATPESATLYGHTGWISSLAIDSSGEHIFSGSYDKTIRIWNVKRDRIGSALNEEPLVLDTGLGVPESLLITRDGDKMIALGNVGSLGIYHLPSLLGENPEDHVRAVTFRNSRLSISNSLITSDDQLLIFSYEHLSNPSNCGIRLWSLQPEPFVQ